jgi:hypothetical protein
MKQYKRIQLSKKFLAIFLIFGFNFVLQEDNTAKRNIQTYAPYELLDKGTGRFENF